MRVEIDTQKILESRQLDSNGSALPFFTSSLRRHMDKYVKKDTGALKNTAQETRNTITYVQPYAHRQYHLSATRDGAPTRGPYWDKRCWAADGETITKEVADFVGGKSR